MNHSKHWAWVLVLVGTLAAHLPAAADSVAPIAPEAPEPDVLSLRFLHGHRHFLLGRLAVANATDPSAARLAWLDAELLEATALLGRAGSAVDPAGLDALAEPGSLGHLQAQLVALGDSLAVIEARLAAIRDDFVHTGETEVLVCLSASPALAESLAQLRATWNGYPIADTQLAPADRAALVNGGYRPLVRAPSRAEPQHLSIVLTLDDGRRVQSATMTVSPAAGALTVCVLEATETGVQLEVQPL